MIIAVSSYHISSLKKLKDLRRKQEGLPPEIPAFDSSEYFICSEVDYLEILAEKPLRVEFENSSCELIVYHTNDYWDRISADLSVITSLRKAIESKWETSQQKSPKKPWLSVS